jgi:hypothetical protein
LAHFTRAAEEPATVPQEVALALAVGRQAAYQQVELAGALATRLPCTLEAMRLRMLRSWVGRGVIPAWLARQIAYGDNATVRRVITDPETGQIVSVGRNAYRPPAGLARLIRVRDRKCRLPGCYRPAQVCDIDHSEQWYADDGETADHNLVALCRARHGLKDRLGWGFSLDKKTGRLTVITPTGGHHTSDPPPLHEPRAPEPDEAESTEEESIMDLLAERKAMPYNHDTGDRTPPPCRRSDLEEPPPF